MKNLLSIVVCVFAFIGTQASASVYRQNDGTISEILFVGGGSHPFSQDLGFEGEFYPHTSYSISNPGDYDPARDWLSFNVGGADLSNANFAGISFNLINWTGGGYGSGHLETDLSGANFSNSTWFNTMTSGANFTDADFSNVIFHTHLSWDVGTTIEGSNFTRANLTGATFGDTVTYRGGGRYNQNNFTDANLSNAVFWSSVTNSNFSGANFSGANFSEKLLNSGAIIFAGSTYDENTIFASSMDPEALGMVFVSAVPLPAGIYLFLSGLIGLGLIKKRK